MTKYTCKTCGRVYKSRAGLQYHAKTKHVNGEKNTMDESEVREPDEPDEPNEPDKDTQPAEPNEPSKLKHVDEPDKDPQPEPETGKQNTVDEPTGPISPPVETNDADKNHSLSSLFTEYTPSTASLPDSGGVDPARIVESFKELQKDISESVKSVDEPDIFKKPAFAIPRGALNPFRGPVVDNSQPDEPAAAGAINSERLFRLTKTAAVLTDTFGKSSFKNLAGEIQRSRKDYINIYDRIIKKHPFTKKMAIDAPELELLTLSFKNIKAARDARRLSPLKTPPPKPTDSYENKPAKTAKAVKPTRGKKPVGEVKDAGIVPLKIDVNKIRF